MEATPPRIYLNVSNRPDGQRYTEILQPSHTEHIAAIWDASTKKAWERRGGGGGGILGTVGRTQSVTNTSPLAPTCREHRLISEERRGGGMLTHITPPTTAASGACDTLRIDLPRPPPRWTLRGEGLNQRRANKDPQADTCDVE